MLLLLRFELVWCGVFVFISRNTVFPASLYRSDMESISRYDVSMSLRLSLRGGTQWGSTAFRQRRSMTHSVGGRVQLYTNPAMSPVFMLTVNFKSRRFRRDAEQTRSRHCNGKEAPDDALSVGAYCAVPKRHLQAASQRRVVADTSLYTLLIY